MRPIIKVENLGKRYRIGSHGPRYATLRESVAQALRKVLHRRQLNQSVVEEIWALKDASFEVMPGEVLGIIGRNRAGKTTLLKLLSRITVPTTGRAEVHGRVGSLLQVGTGFHPELTGRENICLNGAILGMKKREIDRKFDDIVSFAEIDEFLDTPLKHYSTGMRVRLAFAVAAYLEPEILLVDEILAVGDAAFQKKCLGRMDDVAKQGRTVLFVSHNMGAISHFCSTGLVLKKGAIVFRGTAQEAVEFYNHQVLSSEKEVSGQPAHVLYCNPGNSERYDYAVTRIEILDMAGKPKAEVATWDDVVIRIWYSCKCPVRRGSVELELTAFDGAKLLLLSTQPDGTVPLSFTAGEHYVDCILERIPLASGHYMLGAGLAIPNVEWLWRREELAMLSIVERDVYGSGLAPTTSRSLLAVSHRWRIGT